MKKKLLIALSLALTLSLGLSGCGGSGGSGGSDDGEKTYNLRLSCEYAVDNHQTVALQDAADIIKEKTGGKVNITVYPSCQLGDYTVVYGQVMTGDIDIAALPISPSYDERASVVSLPYLAKDFAEFKEDYFPGSYLWDLLSDINDKNDCTLLGIFNAGFMGIGSAALPSEDFNYLTDGTVSKPTLLRIPANNVFATLIPAMGYRTTSISYADLYPALQSGVADGWIGGSGLVNWESFRDVIKYFIDCRAVNECIPIVMNKALLEGMPEEYQAVITDTFLAMAERVADERQEQEEQALKDLDNYGVTVIEPTDEQLEALSTRIRSEVWGQCRDLVGDEIIDDLCETYGVTLE